jgi:hypothetical protein
VAGRFGTLLHQLLRRPILVVFIALVLGGAGFAAAASLGVGSKTLADGATTVISCQAVTSTSATTTTVTPTPFAFSRQIDGTSSHNILAVDVSNIDPTCVGLTIALAIADSSGTQLAAGTTTVPPVAATTITYTQTSPSSATMTTTVSTADAHITVPTGAPAASVAKYAVAIYH